LSHAIMPWQTTVILHNETTDRLWDQYHYPLFDFRIRTQNSDNSSTSRTIFLLKWEFIST
jgi:hypothetical protein